MVGSLPTLFTLPLGPKSQSIVSASIAVLACHQVSATTAKASLNLMTLRTPLRRSIFTSSTDLSVPLKTGHWISAACSMFGTRTSMP